MSEKLEAEVGHMLGCPTAQTVGHRSLEVGHQEMNSTIEAIQLRRGGIPGDVEGLAGEHLLRIHRSQLNLRGQDLGSPEPIVQLQGAGLLVD